jgi:hypothetical protein
MTAPLDAVADLVRRLLLAVLSPEKADAMFIPVFFLVVMAGFVMFVRRALPPLCRAAAVVLRAVVTFAGALVLLVEMAVAGGYRQRGTRPPAVVYNLGDSVAGGVTSLVTGSAKATAVVARAAQINVVVLLLVSLGWIWLWNDRHCPEGAARCSGPVSTWYAHVSQG